MDDMTKNELQTRLESAEKQIQVLQDEIKNLKTKLEVVPENEISETPTFRSAEKYWFVDDELKIDWSRAAKEGETEDYNRFHSEDYAQLFADKCREIAMLLHCKWQIDRDYKPDWSTYAEKHTVYFDHDEHRWTPSIDIDSEYGNIYFKTEEKARKVAEWMNIHARR